MVLVSVILIAAAAFLLLYYSSGSSVQLPATHYGTNSTQTNNQAANQLSNQSNSQPAQVSSPEPVPPQPQEANSSFVYKNCFIDADCDDHNNCTWNSCVNGSCVFTAIKNCEASKQANETETVCDDGIDNDGDGLIDCQDPDCEGLPCMPGESALCQSGACKEV